METERRFNLIPPTRLCQRSAEKTMQIIHSAEQKAGSLGYNFLEPEHFLDALLRNPKIRETMIGLLQVDLPTVEKLLGSYEFLQPKGPPLAKGVMVSSTDRSEKIMRTALQQARLVNSPEITPLDVLRAIALEPDSVAANALKEAGFTREKIDLLRLAEQTRIELSDIKDILKDHLGIIGVPADILQSVVSHALLGLEKPKNQEGK